MCAMSNSACDVIAHKLLDQLESEDCVYRLYSKMTDPRALDPRLKKISNFYDVICNEADEDFRKLGFYPKLEYLKEFRVLVCTLVVAGRLASGRFNYVFVDECGFANEPITMVAGIRLSDERLLLLFQVISNAFLCLINSFVL